MILNLGCGARTGSRCVNVDGSIHMWIARNPIFFHLARAVLDSGRVRRLEAMRENSVRLDLRKGIPFPDGSADAVYQSYLLQHIDRDLENPETDTALLLLKECRRVLRPRGVLRIVVPDFEAHCRRYVEHLDRCKSDPAQWPKTDEAVSRLVGMAVRKEAGGSSRQPWPLRMIENFILGDARRRGQTHQWEYDRFNLSALLNRAGFRTIERCDYRTSRIADWNDIGLDRAEDGREYKFPSLYLEAVK